MRRSALNVLAVLMLITGAACNKLIETVFPGEDITLGGLVVIVPPIPFADSTFEFPAGTFTFYINTDSIIRANTGGAFGINNVTSVKVKQITMNVSNADSDNNLSAFKSFRITISSNTQSTPQNLGQIDIPATAFDSYTATPADSPDITAYIKGTSITYTVYGRVRNITTKTLNVSSTVVVTAK